MATKRRRRNPDENLVFINTEGLSGVVINEETGAVTGVPDIGSAPNRRRKNAKRKPAARKRVTRRKKKNSPRRPRKTKAKRKGKAIRAKNGRFKRVPKKRR